ncbi:hypothetical protein HWB90_gp088 [Mycobacterium phage Fowlmouth]|uniref:Uncharacterized protein n=2 Tax=Fowlmouthvirus fowlmouth TaxID=2845652 RepID=A0A7G8LPZ1_9CAUD|nr:hypothetical protein HWB90_gp088 [Mycobacterium phage Fowlmouth]AYN58051.1 hypothetical protein SEA_FOWLMOUTH_102 [Mycobacterium phage Fowlmouth]QNJ59313.1 hypothetical protein SEA_MRMIYAGI_100 [Mycobacterium phage MrMiyagi]
MCDLNHEPKDIPGFPFKVVECQDIPHGVLWPLGSSNEELMTEAVADLEDSGLEERVI